MKIEKIMLSAILALCIATLCINIWMARGQLAITIPARQLLWDITIGSILIISGLIVLCAVKILAIKVNIAHKRIDPGAQSDLEVYVSLIPLLLLLLVILLLVYAAFVH